MRAAVGGTLILFRELFGNIGWGTECAQGTGATGGRPPAMSACSPYAGALLSAGCCEPRQGQTADIDHRADRGRCEHPTRPAETDRIRWVGAGLPR